MEAPGTEKSSGRKRFVNASTRYPWAMVRPNGPSAARAGSTCIHWWSPVASAKVSIRSWVISSQRLWPRCEPTAARSSSAERNSGMSSGS